jgi:hypothetical protein
MSCVSNRAAEFGTEFVACRCTPDNVTKPKQCIWLMQVCASLASFLPSTTESNNHNHHSCSFVTS